MRKVARPQHFGLCRASLPRTCPGAAKRGPAVLIQPSVRCHADACVSPFCSPPQDTVRTLRPHAHPMSQAAGPTKHAAPTSHASSMHMRPGPLPAGSRHRHQQKKAEAAAGNGTEKWSPKRTRNRPKRWTAKKVQPQSLDPCPFLNWDRVLVCFSEPSFGYVFYLRFSRHRFVSAVLPGGEAETV